MIGAGEFEAWSRGLYRLLVQVDADAAWRRRVREVQRHFANQLPAFITTQPSDAQAAVRASILEDLEACSCELSGISFRELCEPAETERLPAAGVPLAAVAGEAALFDLADAISTFEALTTWLHALVITGLAHTPVTLRLIQRRTLQLLPSLSPSQRAAAVIHLYDASLIFSLLPRISLSGAYLSRAKLANTVLVRGDLAEANLRGAQLTAADLSHATLRRANLITADLDNSQLYRANLDETEMAGASLNGARLKEATIAQANLVRATLRYADLERANLKGANLLGAHFEAAELTGADLGDSNLLWSDFSGARLNQADMSSAVYNAHTRWPAGYDPQAVGTTLIG